MADDTRLLKKPDEVIGEVIGDYWSKKPQVFSSLTTSRGLCILSQSNSYNAFSGKVCSWFGLSPAEGIGVRVGLFLFLLAYLKTFLSFPSLDFSSKALHVLAIPTICSLRRTRE